MDRIFWALSLRTLRGPILRGFLLFCVFFYRYVRYEDIFFYYFIGVDPLSLCDPLYLPACSDIGGGVLRVILREYLRVYLYLPACSNTGRGMGDSQQFLLTLAPSLVRTPPEPPVNWTLAQGTMQWTSVGTLMYQQMSIALSLVRVSNSRGVRGVFGRGKVQGSARIADYPPYPSPCSNKQAGRGTHGGTHGGSHGGHPHRCPNKQAGREDHIEIEDQPQ